MQSGEYIGFHLSKYSFEPKFDLWNCQKRLERDAMILFGLKFQFPSKHPIRINFYLEFYMAIDRVKLVLELQIKFTIKCFLE